MRHVRTTELLRCSAALLACAGAATAHTDGCDIAPSRALVWSPMCFPEDLSRAELEALVASTGLLPPTQAFPIDEAPCTSLIP